MEQDSELQLLSNVHHALRLNSDASQRDLAQYTNLSLGMTNALLRRFADKGWLYMKKISKRNIQYMLTAQGIKELSARSKRYFKNTARLMNEYQSCIRRFAQKAADSGCTDLILVGDNDLEFLFDYACHFCKISFIKIDSNDFDIRQKYVTSRAFIVFSDEVQYEASVNLAQSEYKARCTSVMQIVENAG
ncbi:winged helix-turn-helix transcriptional regulator [Treponema sp. OMZ 840]|uniref:winged helix-turn-helix transcriptional regulator n=1 Tax=Treponema sp. OMZ 840 TaxID=244313 RepID=UPI003D9147A0